MPELEEDFSDRLLVLMKLLKISSMNALATSIGVAGSVVQGFFGKKTPGKKTKPGMDTLEKIKAKYPRVNLNWLVTGEGEPLRPLSWEESATRAVSLVTGSGNAVGNGNNIKIGNLDDCTQQLEHWMERAKTYEALANDRQTIIELMRKAATS